jgi:hypothetical protein
MSMTFAFSAMRFRLMVCPPFVVAPGLNLSGLLSASGRMILKAMYAMVLRMRHAVCC